VKASAAASETTVSYSSSPIGGREINKKPISMPITAATAYIVVFMASRSPFRGVNQSVTPDREEAIGMPKRRRHTDGSIGTKNSESPDEQEP
jgi:hypothetical protein